jgi:hypothetical protein
VLFRPSPLGKKEGEKLRLEGNLSLVPRFQRERDRVMYRKREP